jgi:hypothetical protein
VDVGLVRPYDHRHFTALVTGSTAQSKAITLTRGTWKFRARYRKIATGKASGYSPVATVKIS